MSAPFPPPRRPLNMVYSPNSMNSTSTVLKMSDLHTQTVTQRRPPHISLPLPSLSLTYSQDTRLGLVGEGDTPTWGNPQLVLGAVKFCLKAVHA